MMMMMTIIIKNTYKAATVLIPAALVLVVVPTHHPHNDPIQSNPFVPQIADVYDPHYNNTIQSNSIRYMVALSGTPAPVLSSSSLSFVPSVVVVVVG